jgi:ribosomal protein S18 acetylase RimI-like enzyme
MENDMHTRVKPLSSLKVVNEIVSLHNEVWKNSTGIIDLLKNSSDCFVLHDEKNHVIGYAFVEEDKKRGFIELQDIAVSPKFQGQSGGKILMSSIMRKYDRVKLIVRESNARLIAFYKNLGFELESMIENYYDINEDGARMSWQKK